MRILIIIFFIMLCACNNSHKHHIDPKAKRLTDSALSLVVHSRDYKEAIKLLDEATTIDSNYFAAYNTKFTFLGESKPVDISKILQTLIHLNRLRPELPDFYLYIGLIYLKKGDSITSYKYFDNAVVHYDNFLDTISKTNIGREVLLMNKGYTLIMQGKEEAGHLLLMEIYKQEDTLFRTHLAAVLRKSRKELIDSLSFE